MPTVGFLHTAQVHVRTFELLLAELAPGVDAVHTVAPELLADARERGVDPELERRVVAGIDGLLERGADLVVCTCSTLGGDAERLTTGGPVPVRRVDRPMAEAAVRIALSGGSRIGVVAAMAATLAPTRQLLAAMGLVEIVESVCEPAWELFENGDEAGYLAAVADAARALAPGTDVIVLAQASMAGAELLLADLPVPVLSSPRMAVEAVSQLVGPGNGGGDVDSALRAGAPRIG